MKQQSPLAVRESDGQMGLVVFLHGLGESSLSILPVLEHPLLAHWRLVALDLPGYGRSLPPANHRGLEDHALAVADWLRAQGDGPAIVVGHSMGAVVALRLAELAPELVAAVLDVEGNVTVEDCAYSEPISAIPADEWPNPGFGRIRALVWERGGSDEAHRRYYASLAFADPAVLRRDAEDLFELSQSGNLAGRRARLGPPLHYLVGDPGGAGGASRAALDRAGIPWELIPSSGHWPFVDQLERFVAALRAFLVRAA